MKKLIKHQAGFYNQLVDNGFLVMPIKTNAEGTDHIFPKRDNNNLQIVEKDIVNNQHSDEKVVGFCLITGFNDLEVVDIDSKILPTKKERDEFLKETNSKGVMTRPIWTLMNKLTMFKGAQCDDLKNSEWLDERVVNIPSSAIL